MAQAARDREDYSHPEKIYKNLIYAPNGITPDELLEKRKGVIKGFNVVYDGVNFADKELCWSCGWTVYNELLASYGSRIRIIHTRGNTGIWEVGSRWLIRDQPNDTSLGNDFISQEFLRNQPSLNIPLVKEMRKLSAPTDKVDLTLMSRAQGVGLNTIWHTLSPEQKSNYKDQLGNAIKQWRQFTSPVARKVDGGLLDDCLIGNCLRRTAPTCRKMGRTTDEWFENLEKDLRFGLSILHKTKDSQEIEEKYQELKNNFPKSEPYILTHGDLNLSNIMVKGDKIEAIIDWEYSGYLPWWAERWLSLIGGNNQSDELFDPLWADIGLEMDEDTFQTKVIDNVAEVIKAWQECTMYVEHPDYQTKWLRPGFCECKPFAGCFKWDQLGNQPEHKLRDTKVVTSLRSLLGL
ncbi:uncharacterized protein PAC_04020 [Phialocephala subalpina]|uniref:Aminoglycoside phosphotransferase domain-containing protein n=1 Tax=Phialocephala subalpina TaxID=576137 RepID=A0A1L7WMY7_9HELO|nr:uncharacterized protein PAC_04020 [Phialocephala subalpina]